MTFNMIKTSMDDLQKEAKFSLAKNGLEADGKGGIKVRLVLDHSGSMYEWYFCGAVQRLTEQAIGLASALDDDGTIETWYFGDDVSDMYKVSLNPVDPFPGLQWNQYATPASMFMDPHYIGWVDRSHAREPWGSTNYAAALKAPVKFQINEKEEEPALVIFQTDGGPNNCLLTLETLRDLSGHKTFFAFVVFGEEEDYCGMTAVAEFMNSLDSLTGRVRDNASVFFTGGLEKYATLPDSAIYDGVLGEFVNNWLPKVL